MNTAEAVIDNYLLKEAEYLRNWTDEAVKETRSLERYSLFLAGLIWSWCAAATDTNGLNIIVWFPFFLIALFGMRAWGIAKEIAVMDNYLGRLEKKFELPDGFGWERNRAEKNRSPFEVKTVYLFWGILQAAAFLIAVLYDLNILRLLSKE